MSDNFYTTKTASLKATKADIRNLNAKQIKLNGKPIPSKVLDDRGDFVTDQDLWGTSVTTDENGVVHVSHKFLSNPNGKSKKPWNESVKSVKDNKAYTSTDASSEPLCNIQTEMIKDGSWMFSGSSLTSFSGDLSSLVNGFNMFRAIPLTTFSDDLSGLADATAMFRDSSLTSFNGDLGNLINGFNMFYRTPLESFSGDLSGLTSGEGMFHHTSLASFGGDLSSLTSGIDMFYETSLTSFSGDLSSLVNGMGMFNKTSLTSFSSDLSSLVNGDGMFLLTSLTSFNSDLSSLISGIYMFSNTHKRGYSFRHHKMVDGEKVEVTEHVRAEGLTSFSGDLGSLESGYGMFGDGTEVTYTNEEGVKETTKDITPLDEQSVMIIADTIKDLNGFSDWHSSVDSSLRGIIHIGYDSTVCDAANIEEYCTEIMNKGWTVYLNGTVQTADEGIEGITTTDENGSVTVAPVPYYCKPVEVEQKEANWTDGEKYYIILGAQKVFGDDLSTYGMFTSIEDAAMNMGFTSYEYVEEETKTVEEN